MKILAICLLVLIHTTCLWSQTQEKSGIYSGKNSILDYYLSLPKEFFICDGKDTEDSESKRMSVVKLADINNGYINAEPNGFKMCVAKFKATDAKKDIVVVTVNCGQNCDCNVKQFLEFNGEQWVYSKVLPEKEMNELESTLAEQQGKEINTELIIPRKGNLIKVVDQESKKVLYELKWNGSIFAMANKTPLTLTPTEETEDINE